MASRESGGLAGSESQAGQLLIYRDGGLNLQVRLDGQTVWLTQVQMAELFQTTKQNISLHVQNIVSEKELEAGATVKQYLTVQQEGTRQVQRAASCSQSGCQMIARQMKWTALTREKLGALVYGV